MMTISASLAWRKLKKALYAEKVASVAFLRIHLYASVQTTNTIWHRSLDRVRITMNYSGALFVFLTEHVKK